MLRDRQIVIKPVIAQVLHGNSGSLYDAVALNDVIASIRLPQHHCTAVLGEHVCLFYRACYSGRIFH